MKVKQKHLKMKSVNITESEFVYAQIKDNFKDSFKNLSLKHGIKLKEFTKKLEETFHVVDYKNKSEDEFLDVLILKVIRPVFKDNNMDLV